LCSERARRGAEHGYLESLDLDDEGVLPGLVERDACDGREEIDPSRCHTDLEDDVGAEQVLEDRFVEPSPECCQGAPDPVGVVFRGAYPDIEIFRGAPNAVSGERVDSDDKVLSVLVGQRGQHLDVVAIQGSLLP